MIAENKHNEELTDIDDGISLLDLALVLAERWRLLIFGPLGAGLIAFAVTMIIPPTYTARTVILPPQAQQSVASAALQSLQSLGPLAGAASSAMGLKNPVDQYVALLKSDTIADRIIEAFQLDSVYKKKYREDTRNKLNNNVSITAGRMDGLIRISVDDIEPARAAQIANRYVDELKRLMNELAVTEAQQRRKFFEERLAETRDRLIAAQIAVQASGIGEGALRAEPKAAAETFATLRAQVTAAEVRVQSMRSYLTEQAPAMQQALQELAALRRQLARVEAENSGGSDDVYVGRYREFKYQEALFELYARQYELARADESREGMLVQVVDRAQPPQRKSKPRRALVTVVASLATGIVLIVMTLIRHAWRNARSDPESAPKIERLLELLRLRSA
ncbi:MAG TPA: Wzz/FepE/Etk N-terminal domain-containing protein [Bryobacteraceae bacterium]|nr:Wzz/FepE/Etk N-terminal domain-containing protein [Bryobacteraceae bacterium]